MTLSLSPTTTSPPTATDVLVEAGHVATTCLVPFWNTGYALATKGNVTFSDVALDALFAIPTARLGLGRVARLFVNPKALPQLLKGPNHFFGAIEKLIAPTRDIAVPLYFGGQGIYKATQGEMATGALEIGMSLVALHSHRYRVRTVDHQWSQLVQNHTLHPYYSRLHRSRAMGPLAPPIPQNPPTSQLLDDLNTLDFRDGAAPFSRWASTIDALEDLPVLKHLTPYATSAKGIQTVKDITRTFLGQERGFAQTGGVSRHQIKRHVSHWSADYYYTQKARLEITGFDEHVAPILKHNATAAASDRIPLTFGSTHKTCWPDFAAVWSRNPTAMMEAEAYYFRDNWLAKAMGFSRMMQKIGILFVERGIGVTNRVKKMLGLKAKKFDTARYNEHFANEIEQGKHALKFLSDGRLPISWGQNGEVIEAGIFSQVIKADAPEEFLKRSLSHAASHTATRLGKEVTIVPMHLDTQKIMPKNHGFPKFLSWANVLFWQKNHKGQTVHLRYGAPLKVKPHTEPEAVHQRLEQAIINLSGQLAHRQHWVRQNLAPARHLDLDQLPRSAWIALDRILTLHPKDKRRFSWLGQWAQTAQQAPGSSSQQSFKLLLGLVSQALS